MRLVELKLLLHSLGRYPRYAARRLRRPDRVRIHGVRLDLSSGISDPIRKQIYAERYERGEARCLLARLEPGDRVFEIGGGIGFISTLAARIVGSEAVHTYEANPELLPLIRHTYEINGVAPRLVHAMVSEGEGTAEFYLEPDFWASSSTQLSDESRRTEVPLLDVNREIAKTGPTMVVLDIEGAELELVPKIDWEPVPSVLIELHPHVIGADGAARVVAHLESRGLVTDRAVSSSNKRLMTRP